MTNDQNPAPRPLTWAERTAKYSASKATTTMPAGPIRRPAPKPRRNSVRHRAIR